MIASSLNRYFSTLNCYKWSSLVSFLSVFGISIVVALQPPPPPQYRAEGMLVQNSSAIASTDTGIEIQQQGEGMISENFLLADGLLQQVAQELENRGMFLEAETIRQHTTIRIDREDQAKRVSVAFQWLDPDQAQVTLSLMLTAMVERSHATNRARLRTMIASLDERLPEVETDLRAAEQALERYDREEGPAIQAAQDGSLLEAISQGQQQQRQNQLLLAGIESQIQNLEQQLGLSPEEALTSSALSADPIITQLRSQILETETQLELLSANFRESHPTIQDLQKNLVGYSTLLEARAVEVIGGEGLVALPSISQIRRRSALDPARAALAHQLVTLDTERKALLSQQQILAQTDAQLQQQYSELPNKQLERDRLAQQVKLSRALYDQIQARRIDAKVAEAETVSSLTIAEPAVTTLQAQPVLNPIAVMAIGSFTGIALAGSVAFLLGILDGVIRTRKDLNAILRDKNVQVLGLIPTLPTTDAQELPAVLQVTSPYINAYDYLRSSLKLATNRSDTDGNMPKVILVTSSQGGEGKTTTAFNLGVAAARAGYCTLVFEVDLHQASQSHVLGVQPPEATTNSEYYSTQQQVEPIQAVPQVENLFIVPSLGPLACAAAVLESREMEKFLTDVRSRFDLVILDAPSLSHHNDALVLGRLTDGLVVVTRPDCTEKNALETVLEKLLDREDLNLLGAVINDANVPASQKHSEPYQLENL